MLSTLSQHGVAQSEIPVLGYTSMCASHSIGEGSDGYPDPSLPPPIVVDAHIPRSAYAHRGSHGRIGIATHYHDSPHVVCLLYTSPSPRDLSTSRMPSSA